MVNVIHHQAIWAIFIIIFIENTYCDPEREGGREWLTDWIIYLISSPPHYTDIDIWSTKEHIGTPKKQKKLLYYKGYIPSNIIEAFI